MLFQGPWSNHLSNHPPQGGLDLREGEGVGMQTHSPPEMIYNWHSAKLISVLPFLSGAPNPGSILHLLFFYYQVANSSNTYTAVRIKKLRNYVFTKALKLTK